MHTQLLTEVTKVIAESELVRPTDLIRSCNLVIGQVLDTKFARMATSLAVLPGSSLGVVNSQPVTICDTIWWNDPESSVNNYVNMSKKER